MKNFIGIDYVKEQKKKIRKKIIHKIGQKQKKNVHMFLPKTKLIRGMYLIELIYQRIPISTKDKNLTKAENTKVKKSLKPKVLKLNKYYKRK